VKSINIYLDTNILLGYFNKKDTFYAEIHEIFNQIGLDFYISPITLIEFECKIGRFWSSCELQLEPDDQVLIEQLSTSKQVMAIVELFLRKVPIHIISQTTNEQLLINNQNYVMEDTLVYAYKLGSDLQLRAMDTLQIASALKIRIFSKIDLQYFLTNDQLILDRRNQIHQKIRILPISSTSLLQDLNLS
jgi:predicted nucleic acid-binding protein